MPRLGAQSQVALSSCHPKIQRIINETILRVPSCMDFSVTCGHRGEAAQNEAYDARPQRSTKRWPDSLHNQLPSPAVDLAPYPVEWRDAPAFARLAGYVQAVADELGIEIRWGGDWNGNGRTLDERLVDLPHFELAPDER
jgi:peptidoglycan L-alanyl-D-glutamate endopeptidase CwlK